MLTSFVFMLWLGVSAQIAKSSGVVQNSQMKPFSNENCLVVNETSLVGSSLFPSDLLTKEYEKESSRLLWTSAHCVFCYSPEEAFILLRISYLWYTLIGMMVVLVFGTLVSLLTNLIRPSFKISANQLNKTCIFSDCQKISAKVKR